MEFKPDSKEQNSKISATEFFRKLEEMPTDDESGYFQLEKLENGQYKQDLAGGMYGLFNNIDADAVPIGADDKLKITDKGILYLSRDYSGMDDCFLDILTKEQAIEKIKIATEKRTKDLELLHKAYEQLGNV
jgi:hypothetical protein